MNDAVDLTFLRDITDGNVEMERELFQIFVESSAETIAALRSCSADGKDDEWRKQAHAIKGTSLNLGAGELGRLCKEAQEQFQAPEETKRTLLAAIESEFGRVKTFLENAGSSG